jgi:RNA recognition motif-containing protein
MTEATEPEVVNSEPKVFVGQLPEHTQESAIKQLFSTYGNVKSLSLPRYPNSGDIRRFAIVRFDRWAAAEQAVDDVHGTLKLGGDKPLVVRFADPPKVSAPGSAQSKGIAPRKLFVGQVCTRFLRFLEYSNSWVNRFVE